MASFAFLLLAFMAISAPAPVDSFFGGGAKTSARAAKVSPEVLDEAVEIYSTRFPKSRFAPKKRPFYAGWGMPKRDIDGTEIGQVGQGGTLTSKSLFDIDEQRQRASFAEIARIYGEEDALTMVKVLPNILAFDSNNFGPALDNFGEIFGYDEAKAMVVRNPGLLGISPENAATSTDQTMQFSYIIAYTRPIGKAGLPAILGLVSIPGIEQITHTPIRAEFLAAVSGGTTAEAAAGLQQLSNSLPLMN
mmetsp:Transcript_32251/g.65472  ORF Transcript_32251/g.65472 Transcript_32251/m.65472 type:complete len:248 (-) Transcript_32251:184-927(-)|eukprot:CAMPEP_0178685540 /NCGR_PEP_ID=MMETSP0699-20121125/3440_1 /TAXON_ID=265572 /ORGANISM="Extubocellulus spinifer, Strain CCMP396" /LENGTH=247 /DNA_ID=CAMNT_0020330305 /DNA_START=29 /DNA_END=772 /DNA_ORIENTATION=-